MPPPRRKRRRGSRAATDPPEDPLLGQITSRSAVLCADDYHVDVDAALLAGPAMLWGDGIWETWKPLQKERAIYLPRLALATRMAEREALTEAHDRDDPGWLVVLDIARTMLERYEDDFNYATVTAAALFANDPETIEGLYGSVPGLTSAARLAVVDYWLDTLTAGVLGSRVDEHRLFAYGFAVAVVRELVLVNLGHGAMSGDDADQPD